MEGQGRNDSDVENCILAQEAVSRSAEAQHHLLSQRAMFPQSCAELTKTSRLSCVSNLSTSYVRLGILVL